jgi:hypothetical protein
MVLSHSYAANCQKVFTQRTGNPCLPVTDLRTEERVEEGSVTKDTPPGTLYHDNVV